MAQIPVILYYLGPKTLLFGSLDPERIASYFKGTRPGSNTMALTILRFYAPQLEEKSRYMLEFRSPVN